MYGILNAKHASTAFDSRPYMQEWEKMITVGQQEGKTTLPTTALTNDYRAPLVGQIN